MIRNHSDNFRHFPPFSAIFDEFLPPAYPFPLTVKTPISGLGIEIVSDATRAPSVDGRCKDDGHRRWLPPAAVSVVLAPSHISDHFRPSLEGLLRIKISYGPAVIHSCSGGLA